MKLTEIQDLIKFVAKSGVNEVELQTKDIKIVIRTKAANGKETQVIQTIAPGLTPAAAPANLPPIAVTPIAAPAAPAVSASEKKAADEATENAKYVTIKSPMIGTFYRSPSPDKPVFVNIGDEIAPGKPVCIIEAMKLFNEIESDVKGKIVKILVNDATPVEYDQPLFLVEPN